MKERIELPVELRTTGKHFSRSLRKESKVPAVIYGGKTGNFNVSVDEKAIKKYNTRAYENALFTLKSADGKVANVVALMKEVIVHPLSQRPSHVDFYAIDLTKTIRVWVEIVPEGKAIGIADGGLLNIVTRQVEVECLPTNIPSSFKLDVSGLGVGMALHASDLKLESGLKLISAPELTIAVCNKEEEKAVAAPEAAAAAPAAAAAAPAAGAKAAATPAAAKPAAKK